MISVLSLNNAIYMNIAKKLGKETAYNIALIVHCYTEMPSVSVTPSFVSSMANIPINEAKALIPYVNQVLNFKEIKSDEILQLSIVSENKTNYESDWLAFWEAYPNKRGKAPAKKAFYGAIKKTNLQVMLTAIKKYIAEKPDWQDYCMANTWLNQERWLDDWKPENKGVKIKTNGEYYEQPTSWSAFKVSETSERKLS